MSGRTKPKRTRKFQKLPEHYRRNPVEDALTRQQIVNWINALLTGAGLHAYIGANDMKLLDEAGRAFYIAAEAARMCRMDQTGPDFRILAGSANALADLAANAGDPDAHRLAIRSGLTAAQNILADCSIWAIGAAGMKVEALLSSAEGLTVHHITKGATT